MPLRESGKVKYVTGTSDLSLAAPTGQAFVVRNIKVAPPNDDYAYVYCDTNIVGYFRVKGLLGNHLPFSFGRTEHAHDKQVETEITSPKAAYAKNAGGADAGIGYSTPATIPTTVQYRVDKLAKSGVVLPTILGFLASRGLFNGFPVPEGSEFRIKCSLPSGMPKMVIYDVYDPADIKPDMANGPQSGELLYINYGNAGANINVDGETLLSASANPKEFPGFPFESEVPAKRVIDIYGILASSVAPSTNNGTNYSWTKYLKFVLNRKILFNDDREGLLYLASFFTAPGGMNMIGEGAAVGGNLSDIDMAEPYMLPSPLSCAAGDELDIYWGTGRGGTGTNITTALHEVGIIQRVRPETGPATPAPAKVVIGPAIGAAGMA